MRNRPAFPSPAFRARRRGFTLVEIMIVVLVIGILMAIAIPNFVHARESARSRSCRANLYQIQGAKERWAMDNNQPGTATPNMTDLVAPGVYLKGTPLCPSGGAYEVRPLYEPPRCSVGGSLGDPLGHVIP